MLTNFKNFIQEVHSIKFVVQWSSNTLLYLPVDYIGKKLLTVYLMGLSNVV